MLLLLLLPLLLLLLLLLVPLLREGAGSYRDVHLARSLLLQAMRLRCQSGPPRRRVRLGGRRFSQALEVHLGAPLFSATRPVRIALFTPVPPTNPSGVPASEGCYSAFLSVRSALP